MKIQQGKFNVQKSAFFLCNSQLQDIMEDKTPFTDTNKDKMPRVNLLRNWTQRPKAFKYS